MAEAASLMHTYLDVDTHNKKSDVVNSSTFGRCELQLQRMAGQLCPRGTCKSVVSHLLDSKIRWLCGELAHTSPVLCKQSGAGQQGQVERKPDIAARSGRAPQWCNTMLACRRSDIAVCERDAACCVGLTLTARRTKAPACCSCLRS
eukprot:TRINITY_DN47193_c0_g1_i2.p1 TRINITY_DN47193_c0_g1~~TRINITY_DN47193_c0_g1_i2.p1  ORF type:complete len:147 (-),score=10.08 TRINITY_DN47193_c0_g1_i2:139-579(-)